MKYTKLFSLLLVIILVGSVSLVACGGSNTVTPDGNGNGDVVEDNNSTDNSNNNNTADNNGEEDEDELVVPGMETDVKLSVGDKMPDMEFILHPCSAEITTSFSQYMEDYECEALVIDFWAVWCEPCKEELPYLEDDYRKYGDKGLGVLAVTIDECSQEEIISETLEVDKKIWKSFGKLEYTPEESRITYHIPVDGDREMAKALGVTSIPRTFLIDKDMTILYQHTGFDESKVHALTERIKEALGE
jgi:thiol-disulfide isomerase/thioredoxin